MVEEDFKSYGYVNLYSILGEKSADIYEGFRKSLEELRLSIDAFRKSPAPESINDIESFSFRAYKEFERLTRIFGKVPKQLASDYLRTSKDCLDLLADAGAEREYESVVNREELVRLIQAEDYSLVQ